MGARLTGRRSLTPWLVLGIPILWVFVVVPWLRPQFEPLTRIVIGELVFWGIAAGLIAGAVLRRDLISLGFQRMRATDWLIAVAAAVLIIMLVPVLLALAEILNLPPSATTDGVKELSRLPIEGRVMLILRAGITEELLFRAYPIEWWSRHGGRARLGAAMGLIAFCLLHLPGWGVIHALVIVFPLSLVFALLYMWRRNVILNMTTHALVDAVPLILLPLLL